MKRISKEPYTHEAAVAAGVYGYEDALVVGSKNARWIYRVEIFDFEFVFFSIEMLQAYIDFFSYDVLPARRNGRSQFSQGPAASQGDGQSLFERLPARLRARNKREKVCNVLKEALRQFTNE